MRLMFPSATNLALFLAELANMWDGGDLPPIEEEDGFVIETQDKVLIAAAVQEYGAIEV